MNIPQVIDRAGPQLPAVLTSALATGSQPRVGSTMRVAYLAMGLFFAIFCLWAALAPLSSAAIAPGVLRTEGGGRKAIQHLEGGIIRTIHVREGQRVKAGQTLITLDDTQTGARHAALRAQEDALLAQNARLSAERDGLSRVIYPAELMARAGDPAVRQIMAAQDMLFTSRRNALASQVAILRQRIGQLQSEAGSYSAQLGSVASQERLLDEEVVGVKDLLNKGLERKARLLALQRQLAAAGGQRGALNANIARTRQGVAETDSQIAFVRRQQLTEIASDQRNVEMQLAELRQQLTASRDVSERRLLTAPVDGTVVNLRKVTSGGVVAPGETVVEIVPSNETIVIMARIKPNDIDDVHPGQPAEARLTPYKARVVPLVRGTVEMVSADAKYEEATGMVYYEAEMRMDARQLAAIPGVKLIPGMPAEVFIKLGERSMFSYLVQPLVDSFNRAWREP